VSTEDNTETVHRLVEVFNEGNLPLLDGLFTADFVDHSAPPGLPPGVEGFKLFLGAVHGGFPDIEETVEDLLAIDNKVVTRQVIRGTHQGDYMGIPATGTHVVVSAISIYRFSQGKIAELWQQIDALGMMQQLGFALGPAEA
jgi:steroid delta-isomerase-like uncharacterized protein